MKIRATVLLVVLVGILGVTTCKEVNQHDCGKKLLSVLEILCDTQVMMEPDTPYQNEINWVPGDAVKSLSEGKQEVLNKCCLKHCIVHELLEFCDA